MGRRLIAFLGGIVLLAACSGAGGTAPTYHPLGTNAGQSATVASAGTGSTASAEPSPVAATWATLARIPEGTVVELTGRVTAGSMVSCYGGSCGIDLDDAAGGDGSAILDVRTAPAPGAPGTMTPLPDRYTEADLLLTADDGTPVRSGAVVTVAGPVHQGSGYTVITLRRLRPGPEPSPTPQPSARTVSFATLAKLAKGTVVRIRGRLAVPWFTFCNPRICSIELDDPGSSRSATLYVPAIRGDAPRRNGMLPLPSDFKDSDLAVFTSAGRRVGVKALVWITGTVDDDAVGRERDIEVFAIEPAH